MNRKEGHNDFNIYYMNFFKVYEIAMMINNQIVKSYYANRYQRDFIKMVHASNSDVRFMHFGDIDAGGFWIHRNLCEVTGVDFGLFGMSVNELQNLAYDSCLHKLTDNDRTRLQELKEIDIYTNVIQYMLDNHIKLEQEIVSLELMKNKKL